MSAFAVVVILLLALGCSLLVQCALALDLRAAGMLEVREAEERVAELARQAAEVASHEAERKGLE